LPETKQTKRHDDEQSSQYELHGALLTVQ